MIVIIILIVVMMVKMLDTLSGRLFAVAENYPELRTSDVFAELQRGINRLPNKQSMYNAGDS